MHTYTRVRKRPPAAWPFVLLVGLLLNYALPPNPLPRTTWLAVDVPQAAVAEHAAHRSDGVQQARDRARGYMTTLGELRTIAQKAAGDIEPYRYARLCCWRKSPASTYGSTPCGR